MITQQMVTHIKNKLQEVATKTGNTWTADSAGSQDGIFIVLAEAANGGNPGKILAVSTRLPKDIISSSTTTISIGNIPYTETLSIDAGTAKVFRIVSGTTRATTNSIINDQGNEVPKYLLETSTAVTLFEGALSGNGQTIEQNNSFALTNIQISFT